MLQLPDPAQALTALQKIYFKKGMLYSPHLCQCDRQSGLAKGVCHLQSLQRLPRHLLLPGYRNDLKKEAWACLASSVCRHMSHKRGADEVSAHQARMMLMHGAA